MRLRTKVFIANSIALFTAWWLLNLVASNILMDGFLSVERESTQQHTERVIDALAEEEMNVCRADWAAWDDTYKYVVDRNSAYQSSNLTDDAFVSTDIDFLGIYNLKGNEIWANWRDPKTGHLTRVPEELERHFAPGNFLLKHADAKDLKVGILTLPGEMLIVGSRPIVRTDSTGAIRGTMVMARRLSPERLKRLSERVHLDIHFRPVADSRPSQKGALGGLLTGKTAKISVDPISEIRVGGSTLVPDVYGNAALHLDVSTNRSIYQKGHQTLASLLWAACGVAAFFMVLCMYLIERLILKRLGRIVGDVNKVTTSGELSRRVADQGSDELGQVALAINQMLSGAEAADAAIRRSEAQARRATQMHEMAARRFAELFEGLPVACFSYDAEGTIYEWNRASEALWGIPASEAILRPMCDVIECLDPESAAQFIKRVFDGEPQPDVEWFATNRHGQEMWLYTATIPLFDSSGKIAGAMGATLDITSRKEAELSLSEMNQQLATLAATDGLTGLANQRAFREALEAAQAKAIRTKQPLSVILLDVDRFKAYNDSFGHVEGDEVLIQIGRCLQSCVRSFDLVARYGGEEFILLLPETDAATATLIAERCREEVEAHPWPKRSVTASFGIATWTQGEMEFSQLVSLADRAMYASKEAGRNRVTHIEQLQRAA